MIRKAKKIVQELIKTHNTKDPEILCKKLGVVLLYRDLGKIKGLFRKENGTNFIVINEKYSKFLQKLILLHEIGHMVLKHKRIREEQIMSIKDFTNFKNRQEREANAFVIEFLCTNLQDVLKDICNFQDRKIFKKLLAFRRREIDKKSIRKLMGENKL